MRIAPKRAESLLALFVHADRVVCDKLIESNAARHALSSCLQRSGRENLAQDAEGTQMGRRSAVGPDRSKPHGSKAYKANKNQGGKPKRDVPSHDSGLNNEAASADATHASNVMTQDHAPKDKGNDPRGQQSGRKKRRSRSRRKGGIGPAQAGTGTGASRAKEERAASLSAQTPNRNEASGKDGSGKDIEANAVVSGAANAFAKQSTDLSIPKSGANPSTSRNSAAEFKAKEERGAPKRRPRRRSRNRGNGSEQQNGERSHQQSLSNGSPQENNPGKPQVKGQAKALAKNAVLGKSVTDQRRSKPQQRHHRRDASRQSYAALDLGTNNCRLLVAEPHGQSFRVVDAFSRIVRLGEGLSQTGRLSEDAQERAISALKVCQSKLSYRSVKRFRLIATEACRRATNGASFLNRVHRETGLKLEIVNRETEARLAVSGCASLVHPEADGVVLFDIGGGSSEIVWLDLDPVTDDSQPLPGEKRNRQTRRALRHMSERIRCWTSLQVGVVTLSEKHGGHIVNREQFEIMVEEVRAMLHDFDEREALAQAIKSKHIHMLGTSGTVTTLAGVHLGLERYDRRQVDGAWLNATELRDMIARILDMDFEERTKNPCIGQDRADLVLAGCAILEAFHREWPCARLRVADRGLREGILMEMMIDDGVWNPKQIHQQAHNQTSNAGAQSAKKQGSKKKRSRRRGGRGQGGAQANKASAPSSQPTNGATD